MNRTSTRDFFSTNNILNLQLVFLPVAFMIDHYGGKPVLVFLTACLAIIPLAGWMGKSTEAIAATMGAGLGGLLNATFGNAAELIIGLIALSNGYPNIVKASITGSIIGNILLVLGFSIFLGGWKFHRQKFNALATSMGTTLLVLSAIGLLIPAIFHSIVGAQAKEKELSVEIAVILFLAYICNLIFSLKTHRDLFGGASEEEHGPSMSRKAALTILVASTVGVALASELLVRAVEPTAKEFGFTEVFIGVILVAIIGNAAEHSTAVVFAMKNKMELAMNIAVGSSVQVALLVAPLLVFAGALLGHPLDLVFTTFEVVSVIASVATVTVVAMDGESNWMEGVLLLAVYAILALAFYHLPA
ncbi:MAG: calcium/proton exchanger [Bacteroidota bacterium]